MKTNLSDFKKGFNHLNNAYSLNSEAGSLLILSEERN